MKASFRKPVNSASLVDHHCLLSMESVKGEKVFGVGAYWDPGAASAIAVSSVCGRSSTGKQDVPTSDARGG